MEAEAEDLLFTRRKKKKDRFFPSTLHIPTHLYNFFVFVFCFFEELAMCMSLGNKREDEEMEGERR